MDMISFGAKDIDNILARDPNRVEFLPFGAILIDRIGKIHKYNGAESLIAGRQATDVVGKNFFNDVAPCAKGKKFHGEFLKFAQSGNVNSVLDYEFDYKMKPVKVRIHLKSSADGQNCWLFVKRV